MSYTRTFRKRISVHYRGSKSVTYPASQTGGTVTAYYEGTAYEDVDVEIEVETNPFDKSIANCNNRIGLLTDSVVSMNAAQCKSVRENAQLISDTIIDGFFQSLKSDIGTQKMMLQQAVESRLMLLRQQHKTLLEKKEQMQRDYQRTSARYEKIFSDLDNELSTRIHKLEQPVFDLVKQVNQDNARMLESDLIHIAITAHKENGVAQAHLNSAKVKRDSIEALRKIHDFMEKKAWGDATVRSAVIDGDGHQSYLVPALYFSTQGRGASKQEKCVVPQHFEKIDPRMVDMVEDKIKEESFPQLSENEKNQISSYVQNEMRDRIQGNDPHSLRLRETINKLMAKNFK